MRILSLDTSTRQKGIGPFIGVLLTLLLCITPSFNHAAQSPHVKILYFFSLSCPHCVDAKPAVIALSREYSIEGHNFDTIEAQGYPFPVKRGDGKNAKRVYGIKEIPSLAVLIDGLYKQKIEGASDIQDAKSIIKALSSGAMTVTEAAKKEKDDELTVVGWVVAKGEYFKNVRFMLTDRTTEIQVKAWLPLEVMKSPMKKARPRLMSNVVRKPVVLRGSLTQTDTGGLFLVKEELTLD
jgi:thiol-disulfide isomerase/thioredoxin